MSNGSGGNNCAEIVRSGNHYYILDTKDLDRKNPVAGTLGPLAILGAEEYASRAEKARVTGDAHAFFESKAQHDTLTATEMVAIGAYASEGMLDPKHFVADGHSVIARESMSDISQAVRGQYAVRAALYS